ncbi:hypothetical protein GAR06_04135 [Micromonospora saelicesensis]|nr:hypothetical protein GAR06_04135 [Micromonospora saelicesensis]
MRRRPIVEVQDLDDLDPDKLRQTVRAGGIVVHLRTLTGPADHGGPYFQRKCTKRRPKFFESFSTRW